MNTHLRASHLEGVRTGTPAQDPSHPHCMTPPSPPAALDAAAARLTRDPRAAHAFAVTLDRLYRAALADPTPGAPHAPR